MVGSVCVTRWNLSTTHTDIYRDIHIPSGTRKHNTHAHTYMTYYGTRESVTVPILLPTISLLPLYFSPYMYLSIGT